MRQATTAARTFRFSLALAAMGILSGCAGGGSGDPADSIGNVLARGAFGGVKEQPVDPRPPTEAEVTCPTVDVREGGAAYRVYAGAQTNESLRYQYALGDVVRDCRVMNGQILIKVGVEGKVLLGPAGQASNFSVPVYVGVRAENGEKIVTSKLYNASVSIPSGQSQGAFTVVTDELAVPYLREGANEDYLIFVGFENPGRGAPRPRTARRHR